MPVKKILYLITQSEWGGAQKYVFDLAKSLKNDYEVSMAFGQHNKNENLAELLKEQGIKYFPLIKLVRDISFKDDLGAFWEIRKLIKKVKPDIIHLNSSKASILGSLAASKILGLKPKIVYTAHGWVFNEPLPEDKKRLYLKLEKFTARFKNKIICVSEFDRQAALNNNIAPEAKLATIHNGLEPIDFYPQEEADKKILPLIADSEKTTSTRPLLMVSIGNLYKNKGYDYLIKAAKILASQGLDFKLIIIGDGPEKNDLKNWLDQLFLNKYVILAGPVKNAARLLPAFDLYICSSIKEGLPYTVIEAMSAGLPIIATEVGGLRELITDKKEGVIIKPQSKTAIAQAIVDFYNNPELYRQMGEAAQKKYWREFTLEKMLEKTKKIYQSI